MLYLTATKLDSDVDIQYVRTIDDVIEERIQETFWLSHGYTHGIAKIILFDLAL